MVSKNYNGDSEMRKIRHNKIRNTGLLFEDFVKIAKNGWIASFTSERRKQKYLKIIDDIVASR